MLPLSLIKSFSSRFWLTGDIFLLWFVTTAPTLAQIVPDATLPVNSTVTPSGNTNIIEGGTTAGGNLFHSFREFSIPTGAEAFFNNAVDIQNIFTRVTGGSISNIDGLISLQGSANLFLLNPNGIIFGPNARLNIGGSFFGSTASSIRFADGTFFSASAPQTTPLLTINVPIGLQYGSKAGNVDVQGSYLQVQPGRTLALVGGNVSLDKGFLLAPGGRVELGGVASEGTVGLGINGNMGSLSFPDGIGRANVSVTNRSRVDVTAGGGGSIAINAGKLDILGKSELQAGIASELGSIDSRAGNIVINVTGAVAIANDSFIINSVQSGGIGDAGDIEISTNSLFVTGGAQLQALTRGQGDAGTLKITAGDTVSFDGMGSNGKSSGAFSTVEEKAVGKGGGIEISTNLLRVTNGARLDASTFGKGDAGSVKISATDKVSFDGVGSNGLLSAATSKVGEKASGTGGSIEITTKSLSVTGAARLDVSTLGQGDAGSIKISATDTVSFDLGDAFSLVGEEACGTGGSIEITTKSLSVTGGAQLQASTFGQGDAGTIKITASDTVFFDGDINEFPSGAGSSVEEGAEGNGGGIEISTKSLFVTGGAQLQALTRGQGDAGTIKITASDTVFFDGVDSDGFSSSARSMVEEGAVGNGGGIEITTDSLRITNGAGLTASSRGNGRAGDIVIKADSIHLDNKAVLESNTTGGQGNITLRAQSLQLTRGSRITTNAIGGESGGNIDVQVSSLILRQNSTIEASAGGSKVQGGNITLDTDVIAALENSDITANSRDSRGGQVIINAQSVFGTQFRTAPTSESDITATGGTPEQSGTVQINTPDVDPSSGLIELPANVVDVTALVVDPCAAVRGGSRFSVTGRGGIPPSPDEPLDGDAFLVDLVTIDPKAQGSRGAGEQRSRGEIRNTTVNSDTNKPDAPVAEIVEATGWYTNEKGEVVLTASTPTRYRVWQTQPMCK